MLHDKCGDPIGSTSDDCWGYEVDKHKYQYEELENSTYFEPFDMESQDNSDSIEDFLFFNINLSQKFEFESQGQDEHTKKAKKHNPFYVPSKVVREMVRKTDVE